MAARRTVVLTRLFCLFGLLVALFNFRDLWFPVNYVRVLSEHVHPLTLAESLRHFRGLAYHQKAPVEPYVSKLYDPSAPCAQIPGLDGVLVILKTGATAIYQRLPTHFVTTLRCLPNVMIFSDLEQTFADYPIHDAIEPVSESTRNTLDDFDLYRKLQQYLSEGQDLRKLKGDSGWKLDKWKFLPMMHRAFRAAGPEIKWFVLIEADTSISWTNLLQFLNRNNPEKPFFAGSSAWLGDTEFAHGGSGIVISRRAADMLEKKRAITGEEEYDKLWEDRTQGTCCGDEIVARAFIDIDVHLAPTWPLIQGETINSLDWSDRHWCVPAITWHHVSPGEIDALWQFESKWIRDHGTQTPFLYRDVYDSFVAPHIDKNRTQWNNLSIDRRLVAPDKAEAERDESIEDLQDWEKAAVESPDACAEACFRAEEECIQWMFSPGRCQLGKVLRYGNADESEENSWTSGWMQERVSQLREKFQDCEIKWSK